jgi:tartrate-resistant acid phosphatase type 5
MNALLACGAYYSLCAAQDWYSPGNVSAQVDPALRARDSRWLGLQAGTRSFYASAADVTPLLTLVFVDTSPWLLSYRSKKGSMNWTQGGIPGVGEAPYDSFAGRLAWAAWEDSAAAALEAQLSACTSRWRIVVGHHPIYSYAGRHSSTIELTRLNGILRRGGAHAYLNGHDHVLQLIVPPTSASMPMAAGPFYLTSGAGSKCSNDVAPPPPDGSLLFAHGWQGFNSMELNATALRLLSYDVDGRLLHSYVQPWAATPLCGSTQDGGVQGALALRADADPRCGPPPTPAADNAGFVRDASSSPENQASSGGATGPVAFDNYQLVGSLQLSGNSWDSVAYDAANQVLYLGRRGDGLAYVDARDPTALRSFDTVPGTSGAKGVLLMPQLGIGASLSSDAALFTLPSVANGFRPSVLGTAALDSALGSPADGAFLPQSAR